MKNNQRSNFSFRNVRAAVGVAALAFAWSAGLTPAQVPETPVTSVEQTAAGSKLDKSAPINSQYKEEEVARIRPFGALEDGRATALPSSAKNPIGFRPGSATVEPSNQASIAPGWEFSVAPYLYMTGLKGTVGARGRTAEVDMSFGDVIENLNLGLMGAFEARKDRFVFVNDLMWIKLGEERDTPGELHSSVKVGVNLFLWDPEAGYRVYASDRGSIDILGGARLMSLETNINFREGVLPASDVSERKTWATPVVGARGTLNLSPKVFLSAKFDIGGGLGADFTTQFYGGGGYRITPKIAIIGGYRYLKTDYDSEAGFLFDTDMNGILIGAKFTF